MIEKGLHNTSFELPKIIYIYANNIRKKFSFFKNFFQSELICKVLCCTITENPTQN